MVQRTLCVCQNGDDLELKNYLQLLKTSQICLNCKKTARYMLAYWSSWSLSRKAEQQIRKLAHSAYNNHLN